MVQNLFLYGYGAIFNFLGILATVIYKGMGLVSNTSEKNMINVETLLDALLRVLPLSNRSWQF